MKGQFLKVPLLIGNNANEGDIFAVIAEKMLSDLTTPFTTEALSDLITNAAFNCPASQTAADRVKAGVTAFRYRYAGQCWLSCVSFEYCLLLVV